MMDNATNNDTLVEAFERMCKAKKIPFSAKNSRLRCMPHTVHLAVLKVGGSQRYLVRITLYIAPRGHWRGREAKEECTGLRISGIRHRCA